MIHEEMDDASEQVGTRLRLTPLLSDGRQVTCATSFAAFYDDVMLPRVSLSFQHDEQSSG